jgi:pimeloyl-ACP methyl ester carboxylesterase
MAEPQRWWGGHLHELRWQLEAGRLLADPVFYGRGVPHGDGRPVLLLPGLFAGDYTLAPLALWLRRIGYRSATAGFLANVGCSERALQRVARRARVLRDRTGRRVAIIGHSRGAHYARALAARNPDLVSHAIAVGGGLTAQQAVSAPTGAAVAAVRAVHRHTTDRRRRRGCLSETCMCRFGADYSAPLPDSVLLTSIYSRQDGVVCWRSCVSPDATCVEVTGSHVGLIYNRAVYRAIGAALCGADNDVTQSWGAAANDRRPARS